MKIKTSQINMTEGSVAKKTILFSIPILLSGWLQILYSAADLITCGNFGSEYSVGAISATSSITYLFVSLCLGFSVGANVMIAQAYGEKNKEKAERIIGTSYLLALICGVILLIVGLTCSRLFLTMMNTPSNIIDLSTIYMQIYFIGMPFTMIYNFGAALLRGMGDTTKPFIYLMISGLINVGLNFLFVIVFKLDVMGVGLTTMISQIISGTLVTISLLKNKNSFALLKIKNIRIFKAETINMIKIGLPAGIQSALFSLSNVVLQSSINSFGADCVTGAGAESNIENFLSTGVDAFAQAAVAFVGANYGARDKSRIKKSVFYASLYAVIFSLIGGVFCYFLGDKLLRIYTSNQEAIAYGYEKMKLVSVTYIAYALVCTISSSLRGLGYSFTPMVVSLFGICVIRIIYVYTFFQIEQFHTIFGLYLSYPLSWVIALILHIISFIILSRKTFKQLDLNRQA